MAPTSKTPAQPPGTPGDEPTARGLANAAAAGIPTPEDNLRPGQRADGDTPSEVTVGKVGPALFVSEGTRQELLGGGRAYDYRTGRELVLEGDDPGTVRFKTDAEIAADPPPGQVSTADVATLNPS